MQDITNVVIIAIPRKLTIFSSSSSTKSFSTLYLKNYVNLRIINILMN